MTSAWSLSRYLDALEDSEQLTEGEALVLAVMELTYAVDRATKTIPQKYV